MEQLPLLDITIIESDTKIASLLRSAFEGHRQVKSVSILPDTTSALDRFRDESSNALLINIFDVGIDSGVTLIENLRNTVKHIPICLLGSTDQLTLMTDVNVRWRSRFKHYYKLQTDLNLSSLSSRIEQIIHLFGIYLLSRMASSRLREIKAYLEHPTDQDGSKSKQHEIKKALELAEHALEAKQQYQFNEFIIPGFDDKELQAVVKDTLHKASSSLEQSSNVNKGILIFGGVLVATAFIVASYKGSWEAVSFGGIGLAGIIASLITNPLKGIASSARRLVQIQVAYVGFLHVLGRFNLRTSPSNEADALNQIEAINQSIRTVLEVLEKHCK